MKIKILFQVMLIFFCLGINAGASASGDILFLNINNNDHELEVLEKYARTQSIKVYVIPQRSNRERILSSMDYLKELKRQLDKANSAIEDKIRNGAQRFSDLPEYTIVDEVNRKIGEHRALTFDKKTLYDEMKSALENLDYRFQKIVVSGHSDGFTYSGALGMVDIVEINRSIRIYNQKNHSFKSLLLLGCYGVDDRRNLNLWLEGLVDVDYMFGSKTTYRLGQNPEAKALLEIALKDSERSVLLDDANSATKEQRTLKKTFQRYDQGHRDITIYRRSPKKDSNNFFEFSPSEGKNVPVIEVKP